MSHTNDEPIAPIDTEMHEDADLSVADSVTEKEPTPARDKFLFIIERRPGVANRHLFALYAVITSVFLFGSFWGGSQQFVLQHYLHIPRGKEGQSLAIMQMWTEIFVLPSTMVMGAVSDAIGSRIPIYVFGLSGMALGIAGCMIANTLALLTICKVMFQVGITASLGMNLASLGDYVADTDRGKATGLFGLCMAAGQLISNFVFMKLPHWFATANNGYLTTTQAGILSFAIVSLLAICMTVVSATLLHRGVAYMKYQQSTQENTDFELLEEEESPGVEPPKPVKLTIIQKLKNVFSAFIAGVLAARNPLIFLGLLGGIVAHADAAVGSFISMWVNQDMQAKGASETEALAFAGTMLGLSQVFNIGTSPVIGFVIDRINRVYMVIITAVVSLIAYYSMFFLSDATTTWMLVIIVFVSIGNTGVTVSCNVLLADASKNEERGAVMGLYKLLGSLGMFGAAVVGGYLFDYRHWSPFAFIGGFNTILTIVAIVVAIITRNK